MVERELRARPNFSHRVLQQFAANLDPEIARMDPRRFHAEFIVPVQRRIGAAKPAKSKSKKGRRVGRSRTRATPAAKPKVASTHAPRSEASQGEVRAESVHERSASHSPANASDTGDPREIPGRAAARRSKPAAEEAIRAGPRAPTTRRRARSDRDIERRRRARVIFYEWARALADAESDVAIIEILGEVDRYVSRFLDDEER